MKTSIVAGWSFTKLSHQVQVLIWCRNYYLFFLGFQTLLGSPRSIVRGFLARFIWYVGSGCLFIDFEFLVKIWQKLWWFYKNADTSIHIYVFCSKLRANIGTIHHRLEFNFLFRRLKTFNIFFAKQIVIAINFLLFADPFFGRKNLEIWRPIFQGPISFDVLFFDIGHSFS